MKTFNSIVLPIDAQITIFGHTFNGLSDVREYVDAMSSIGHRDERGIWDKPYISSCTPKKYIPGIHILEIYERYPCFDSSDYAYEDRYYRNYFFSQQPFTRSEIKQLALLKYKGNCELDPTSIPAKYAHLYYVGEGDNMVLTTP